MHPILREVTTDQLRKDIPEFKAGDTVRVYVKVKGGQMRSQLFEGVVIQRRGSGIQETFTVRKISHSGVGVERIFPLHSPQIEKIEVVRRGKVRRAKLFYLRKLRGKAARIKEAYRKK